MAEDRLQISVSFIYQPNEQPRLALTSKIRFYSESHSNIGVSYAFQCGNGIIIRKLQSSHDKKVYQLKAIEIRAVLMEMVYIGYKLVVRIHFNRVKA